MSILNEIDFMMIYYNLFLWLGQRSICRCEAKACRRHALGKKTPPFLVEFIVFALPIFAASHPATIVGANELNFCVRDGNRWTLIAINTNSYGWVLTHLLSLKRRRALIYLVTHTGFEPMLTA